jgi:hypothetical protein
MRRASSCTLHRLLPCIVHRGVVVDEIRLAAHMVDFLLQLLRELVEKEPHPFV